MMEFLMILFTTADPASFKHFKKSGTESVCLVDYQKRTVSCEYKTMNECRNMYENHKCSICFPRKGLKLEGDN